MSRILRWRIFRISGLLTLVAIIVFIVGSKVTLTESTSASIAGTPVKKTYFEFQLPDTNICRGIRVNLRSGLVIDNGSHRVIYSYNAHETTPVASISKLLTAMVVLDNYNPDSIIVISKDDCYKSSRSILRFGDRVKVRDLLCAALIRSDNRAARAVARSVTSDINEFAALMNSKALEIGMENTIMFEPTGLDERNRSTAADCARLVNAAISYPEIARITSLKEFNFKPINRRRGRKIVNTNKLLFSRYRVLAGKTGYISESAYCLTTIIEDRQGRQLTVVVLGAPGPNSRFSQARRLANWAFQKL
ncbi:conserved hypothetical protein [Candidatus Zixiibacteriota bacterium]|nr:conserved hypothetical protein [candidate division Zixibacteria bacterium]